MSTRSESSTSATRPPKRPRIYALPLDAINPPPLQLRDTIDPDDLRDLAQSMALVGLRNPISVRRNADRYDIEAGHRRYLAAQLLGWKTIDALLWDDDAGMALAASVHENIFREDLTPLEEARTVYHLLHTEGKTPDEAARVLRHTKTWVLTRAEILTMPEELQAALHDRLITLGVARALAQIGDPAQRTYAIDAARTDGLTERSALLWVKQWELAEATRHTPQPAPLPTLASVEAEADKTICDLCEGTVYRNVTKLLVVCFDCIRAIREGQKQTTRAEG